MRFSLSIVLDENGNKRFDLYQTSTLKEMDEYLLNFQNSQGVREMYQEEISEFLLDNMTYIKESEKRNKRANNGRICLVYVGKNNQIRMFPIIYDGTPRLMSVMKCFSKIKKELTDDIKLRELINRKRYLLSQYEIDLLSNYLMYPVSYKRYKYIFIDSFINRLKNLSSDKLYMYLRSLMNLCDLKEGKRVDTRSGVIKDVGAIPSATTLKRNNIVSDCEDELFMQLYQSGDYERLHELYDIEEIDRYIKEKRR